MVVSDKLDRVDGAVPFQPAGNIAAVGDGVDLGLALPVGRQRRR